ncbi:glycosyltransferase, partial [candidate division KSB1 bacterium]|nr:glycosyltransferase [candidate division KSB1 bacterium]
IKQLGIESHVTVLDRYVANEEIPFYFAAADLLVMPYTSATGSGLVQLAFGLNMPVIVSNVGALPEVVRDGETGFVVPARDANAVAEKVVQYYHENLETRFRENVKKDLPRFSWEGLIDKIETLYRTAS